MISCHEKKLHRNGFGTEYFKDNTIKYVGYFKNDKYDGNGTKYIKILKHDINYINELEQKYKFVKGGKYVGLFKEGKYNDMGSLYDKDDKKIFEGQYKNGMRCGYGVEYMNDTKIFDGQYNNGTRNGSGIEYYSSGVIKFEGFYKNGRRCGPGIEYYKNSCVKCKANYIDNYYKTGPAIEYYKNGYVRNEGIYLELNYDENDIWKGTEYYKNGKRKYKGKYNYKYNKDMYMRDGKGIEYYKNGRIKYNGFFKNNLYHGLGIYYFKNEKWKGIWKKNIFIVE